MRRIIPTLIAVCALTLGAAPVLAGGPAETHTETVKNLTESFPDFNPCTGDPGVVTVTYNGVFHMTQLASGELHLTGTLTGQFVFEPDDSSLPSYTGRFTNWFGENHNQNQAAATFTFRLRGVGSDGSTVTAHGVSHITAETIDFSAFPPIVEGLKVMFDKFDCTER
jgi:hypothetical protein